MFRACLAAAAIALTIVMAGDARAADATIYKAPHPVLPAVGPCNEASVLREIAKRFDRTEAQYWHTGARIALIIDPRQAATRLWPPETTLIHHCVATAYLTDGGSYELVYWLRSHTGFAGYGWGVEFCLVGRDRHMSYSPRCRQLRPL